MLISLTPDQEAWIQSHVATGDFSSIEEAARHLIDERIAERELEDDDLAWAKPFVDQAREAVARGEFVTLDQHRAHMAAVLDTLKA